MIPYIIHKYVPIGPFTIAPHGIMIFLGVLIGVLFVLGAARKKRISPNLVINLFVWVFVGAFIGAKLFWLLKPDKTCSSLLGLVTGGYAWYGGLIGGLVGGYFFSRRHKINFWKYADLIVPGLAIGYFFGRIGCHLAACTHGKATQLFWGLNIDGVVRHPAMIYESLIGLVIFVILMIVKDKKRFEGYIFLWFIMLYSVLRFLIEYTKFETVVFGLTASQWISIPLFFGSLGVFWYKNRKI